MQINHKDIQRAVSLLLKQKGFVVLARESVEGGARPACSVDVFPSSSERLNPFIEEDSFNVEITYYPKTETQESLSDAADRLKLLLLLCPLEIKDRTIETYKVDFSKSGTALVVECDYTFEQAIESDFDDTELMQDLKLDILTD